jgi:hypothetical protein
MDARKESIGLEDLLEYHDEFKEVAAARGITIESEQPPHAEP